MTLSKKSRIPTISPDRLDTSPSYVPSVTSYSDRRAKAFIKGKEPTIISSLRIPESNWSKLKLLSFYTKESLNHLILAAINCYLSQSNIKGKLARGAKKSAKI